MRGIRSTFLASTVAVLCACGGGSGGGSTPNAVATGIWQGTMSIDEVEGLEIIGLVVGAEMRFVSLDANAAYAGLGSINGNDFTAEATGYDLDSGVNWTSEISGTISTGESISATYTGNGQTGAVELAYDPLSNRGSSFEKITGTWFVTDGSNSLALTVTDGEIDGSDTDGCVYSGSISFPDADVNIYSMELEVSSCGEDNGAYEGFAVLGDQVDDSEASDLMLFFISNPDEAVVGFLEKVSGPA